MKFMLTFDWSPDTEARAEGIVRFQDTGGFLRWSKLSGLCAPGTSGHSLTQLHPPAAGCVPLMANAERKETWRVWCAITSKSDSYLHFGSAGGKASNLRADTTLCSARKLDLAGSGEVFNRLRVKWNNGTTAPGRAVDP